MSIFDSLLKWLGLAAPAAPVKSDSTAHVPDNDTDAIGYGTENGAEEDAEAAYDGSEEEIL